MLDEPLSALDLKLRQAVRVELKQLQRNTGITFIFVTHDQEEALTMSDWIAVMSDGEIQQIGTPREIYEAPKNRFAADFIGEINILNVLIQSVTGEQARYTLPGGREIQCPAAAFRAPGPGHLAIRPERLTLTTDAKAVLAGKVTNLIYPGTDLQVQITLDDGEEMTVRVQSSDTLLIPEIGARTGVDMEADAARLLVD